MSQEINAEFPLITIKHRFTGSVIWEGKYESVKAAVIDAVAKIADLRGADLTDADLTDADLEPVKADIWMVLTLSGVKEAEGLASAIRLGKINGELYEGECACLVGTIANVRGCSFTSIPGLAPNSSRPAERWFLALKPGDTPENSPIAAITLEWVEEWIRLQPVTAEAVTE